MSDTDGYEAGNAEELTTELPIARVKRIMKLGEGVKMVSNEAAVKLAYCVDLLIGDVTKRSWNCATQNHRRTFLKWDIQEALIDAEHLDFLIDIVPTNETRQQKKDKKPTSSQESFAHHMIAKMNIQPNKMVYIHVMKDMHIQSVPQQSVSNFLAQPQPQQQYIRIQPQPTYQFVMNPDPSQGIMQLANTQQMFTTMPAMATQQTEQQPTNIASICTGQQMVSSPGGQSLAFAPQNGLMGQMILLNQAPGGQLIQTAPPQIVQTQPQVLQTQTSININGNTPTKVGTRSMSTVNRSTNEPKNKRSKIS